MWRKDTEELKEFVIECEYSPEPAHRYIQRIAVIKYWDDDAKLERVAYFNRQYENETENKVFLFSIDGEWSWRPEQWDKEGKLCWNDIKERISAWHPYDDDIYERYIKEKYSDSGNWCDRKCVKMARPNESDCERCEHGEEQNIFSNGTVLTDSELEALSKEEFEGLLGHKWNGAYKRKRRNRFDL